MNLSQTHIPNAHTLSHRTASHSYVNVAYKSPVASQQRLAFLNVLRITYNLPHNHTRLRNFNNPYPPMIGIPSLSFPNRGNINNTISMSQANDMCGYRLGDHVNFLMRMQCQMLCHSLSMPWNAFNVTWHSYIQYNKHGQSINSRFLKLQ